MNISTNRQLVMGLATGMTLEQLKPFFLSLEKSGYRGDVCLFISNLDAASVSFLRARRVNLVPFRQAFLDKPRWLRFASLAKPFLTPNQAQLLDEHLATAYMHPNCARFVYHRFFLDECGGNYDQVMLADIRDVLFQSDPFAFEMPDGLAVFLEDPSQTIGSCPSNSAWIRHGFGKSVLNELAAKPIACAGTILGTTAAIRDYVERKIRIFCQKKLRLSIDQATHNFILYQEPPPALRVFDNDAGPVLTMGYVSPEKLRFNQNDLLVNTVGRVFNTLHQYDRHPDLRERLLRVLT